MRAETRLQGIEEGTKRERERVADTLKRFILRKGKESEKIVLESKRWFCLLIELWFT